MSEPGNTPPATLDTAIDFGSQDYLAAPWRALRRIAETEPIFWSDRLKAWIVGCYEDVKAGHTDRRLSSARMDMYLRTLPGDPAERFPTLVKYHSLNIVFLDQPSHLRIRTLMLKAFGRRQIEALTPDIVAITHDVLDQAEAAGEFDFKDLVAAQLPMRVIQTMLGVPRALTRRFFDLVTHVARAIGSPRPTEEMMARADEALVELNGVLAELIAERRRMPTDDLLSVLVHARDADDRLDEDELLAACHAIIEGGGETTSHMLGIALVEIAKRDDLKALVRSGLDGTLSVVNELLRFPGLLMGNARLVAEPFEWHGKKLGAGDVVFLMICAANIDPARFDDPERIDPARPAVDRSALSFGPGIHHCIGHFLARNELSIVIHAMFDRFDVEILERDPQFVSSFLFHGYEHLTVRFTPRVRPGIAVMSAA